MAVAEGFEPYPHPTSAARNGSYLRKYMVAVHS